MARIPEEVIERVKREVSLVRLVELAGIELQRQGKDLVGRCPFHEDRTPSLVVSPESNLWHCLGACQVGGSVIDWTMRREGVSFPHAVELLRDGVAPTPVNGRRAVRSTVTRLSSPLPAGANDRELMERVVGFYAQTLKESPQAVDYLKLRGLHHGELVERFRLGYANRTLGFGCRRKTARRARSCAARCNGWVCCVSPGTSTCLGRWWSRCLMSTGRRCSSMGARSAAGCGRARHVICICRVRVVACSTATRWRRQAGS